MSLRGRWEITPYRAELGGISRQACATLAEEVNFPAGFLHRSRPECSRMAFKLRETPFFPIELLQRRGARIATDDLGTGSSNL
jgi:hypothetical protein